MLFCLHYRMPSFDFAFAPEENMNFRFYVCHIDYARFRLSFRPLENGIGKLRQTLSADSKQLSHTVECRRRDAFLTFLIFNLISFQSFCFGILVLLHYL